MLGTSECHPAMHRVKRVTAVCRGGAANPKDEGQMDLSEPFPRPPACCSSERVARHAEAWYRPSGQQSGLVLGYTIPLCAHHHDGAVSVTDYRVRDVPHQSSL
jgi:hypothetical protein